MLVGCNVCREIGRKWHSEILFVVCLTVAFLNGGSSRLGEVLLQVFVCVCLCMFIHVSQQHIEAVCSLLKVRDLLSPAQARNPLLLLLLQVVLLLLLLLVLLVVVELVF